jgi:c-di-GMP-binding flagellar brake protein YcgR
VSNKKRIRGVVMENIHFIIIGIAFILLIGIIFYFKSRKSNEETKPIKELKEIQKPNKRDNFRLRIDVEDALLEVTKIGDIDVSDSEVCEIVDISASGMGIYSDKDYPIRNNVLAKLYFKLNYKEFSFDGILVRKVEVSNKQKIQYGVKFINLSDGDQNRLLKEIAAIDNSRRKIQIK